MKSVWPPGNVEEELLSLSGMVIIVPGLLAETQGKILDPNGGRPRVDGEFQLIER